MINKSKIINIEFRLAFKYAYYSLKYARFIDTLLLYKTLFKLYN